MTTTAREAIRQRYLNVDTATVADVLDKLGMHEQGLAPCFTPFPADCGKMAGWAYTIRGQMTPYANDGGDPDKMKAVDGVRPGIRSAPPRHGQDTRTILAEYGYSDEDVIAMIAAGVVSPGRKA